MRIDEEQRGNAMVVRLREKRIDASLANRFKGEMIDRVNQGHECLVIDLSDVEFLDSSGLGVIIAAYKMLGGSGGLLICGVRPEVASIFRITRIDKVIPMHATSEEALKSRARELHG